MKKIIRELNRKQCVEFGLVAVLVTALLAWYYKGEPYLVAVFLLSLVTLMLPILFYPFAAAWFILGYLLHQVSSRVLLTVIFFLVVFPVAFIRRIAGKDNLKIRQFKKEKQSVLVVREHLYKKADLLHSF